MISASRRLVPFSLDCFGVVDLLTFREAGSLDLRDFLGALLIGYYMCISLVI